MGALELRGSTILPTHKCFDDALDYLVERVKRKPELAHGSSLILVHGICLIPEGTDEGRRFAHAWVEEDDAVWQSGLLDGELIYYAMPLEDFTKALRVQESTRYTVRQAAMKNETSGHYGPWLDAYRALCRDAVKGVLP